MNKVLSLIIFSLFISIPSRAHVSKVLIIDTLVNLKPTEFSDYQLVQLCLNHPEDYLSIDSIQQNIHFKRVPNVIVSDIKVDNICLPLDNKGGTIQFKNLSKCHCDTIRIAKWTIYDNGITDTISGAKYIYQVYNDSTVDIPHRVNPFYRRIKHKGIKELNEIHISLNNVQYTLPVNLYVSKHYASGHGHFPRRKYERAMKNKNPDKIYKHKYFYYTHHKKVPIYNAIFDFKERQ